MELSILLANKIVSMGIMILTGFVFCRLGFLKKEYSTALATVAMYILSPAIIIKGYQVPFEAAAFRELLFGFVIAFAIHVFFIVLGRLFYIPFHMNKAEESSLVFTNCGNLIVPLIGYVLGEEYVFYTSAYITLMNLVFWTWGASFMSGTKTVNVKKILLNPNMIAIAIGLCLYVLQIHLPEVVGTSVNWLASCIGPISMLGIGIVMGSYELKKILLSKRIYVICFLRLIIMPALLILVIRLLGLWLPLESVQNAMLVAFLAAIAPTAVYVTQYSELSGLGEESVWSAGAINVLSTILCIITMPVMLYFFQL